MDGIVDFSGSTVKVDSSKEGVFNVPDEDESLLRDENDNFQKKQTA